MNAHTIRSSQLQLLKEKVHFAEIRKKVSEFEEKRNMLELQQEKYHLASLGLLNSASSVAPRSGIINAESLHQRSHWIEKAYFLRSFSQANENKLRSEILDLVPSQEAASRELRYAEEHKSKIEKTIRTHIAQLILIKEEAECSEAADVDVLKKHLLRQYGGK
jgi:hypothetical protein